MIAASGCLLVVGWRGLIAAEGGEPAGMCALLVRLKAGCFAV